MVSDIHLGSWNVSPTDKKKWLYPEWVSVFYGPKEEEEEEIIYGGELRRVELNRYSAIKLQNTANF